MAMWIKGSRNVFDGTMEEKTTDGLTVVANSPYIKINGFGLSNTRSLFSNVVTLPAGTYTAFCEFVSGECVAGNQSKAILFYLYKANEYGNPTLGFVAEMIMWNNGLAPAKVTFTLEEETKLILTSYSRNDTYNDAVFAFQVVKGKVDEPLPYEPYRPPQKMKPVFKSRNVLSIEDYDGEHNGVRITIKDGKLTLNGTSTGVVENFLPLKIAIPAGTYTMDGGKVGRGFSLYLHKGNNNYADRLNIFNSWYDSGIVTVKGSYDYTYLMVYYPIGKTFNNETIDLMLAKGNKPFPLEPYFPLTKFKAIPKSRNLLNIPEKFTWTGYTTMYLTLSAGTYTISRGSFIQGGEYAPQIAFRHIATNTLEQYFRVQEEKRTFPLVGGEYEIRFYTNNADWSGSQGITSTINKLMLNKGDTALPYEPPQEIWK